MKTGSIHNTLDSLGSHFSDERALEWINADKESVAAMGWATLSSFVAIKSNTELDLQFLNVADKSRKGYTGS